MARALLLLAVLAAGLAAQAAPRIVLVIDKAAQTPIAEALRRGADAAVAALANRPEGPKPVVVAATPEEFAAKDAFPDAAAVVAFASAARVGPVLRAAQERKIPVFDLGAARVPRGGAYDLRGSLAAQAASASYWIFGPLAHHHVALLHGAHAEDRDLLKAFAAAAKAPKKTVGGTHAIGSRPEAVAKDLQKEMSLGATAFFVAAGAEEGRIAAEAAKLVTPPPVIVLAMSALGFEPRDAKEPGKPGAFPDGTVVMDADLPGPGDFKTWPGAAGHLALEGDAAPWCLAAFDAVAIAAAKGPEPAPDPAAGVRRGRSSTDARYLVHTPLIADGGRLVAVAGQDPKKPRPRPAMDAYDPETGFGAFSRWSTLHFETRPDTVRCEFRWTDGKIRSIEEDLAKLKIGTRGRLPPIDHLVREKLMARLLSITGEKYGLQEDGTPVPGKSFQISMTARPDKVKAKRTWPCYVAGDDPDAGGRAFGSYCFIYSTFMQRTIFSNFDLFDEEIGTADFPVLTGVLEEEGPYITGTRRDAIFRLVDNFAGSLALTAAHEIGHLAGLGHDEDDPCGIMNVKEGAGIKYQDGHFTPTNEAALEKSLGRLPAKTRKTD